MAVARKKQASKKTTTKKAPTKKKATTKKKMGRPRIDLDWNIIDGMCAIHCTELEIANVLGVSVDTLNNHSKRLWKKTFSEYSDQKRDKGRASLRRRMWQQVENGNIAMTIFLAKNWLGMSDRLGIDAKAQVSTKATVVFESNGREVVNK